MQAFYRGLIDSIDNLPDDASSQAKKNVLMSVVNGLIENNEVPQVLKGKARMTKIALDHAPADVNMDGWLNVELATYSFDMEEQFVNLGGAPAPQEDVNMAVDGGRKRRRGKKATKKAKKTRRYTRRR